MNITRTAFRIANYVALVLSFAGLFLVCSFIMGEENTVEFAISFLPQITVGYAVMILFIEVVGFPIRAKLIHFVAGSLYAFALFMIGVFAASVTSMFVYQDFDSSSYIVGPVLGLGIYGFISALILSQKALSEPHSKRRRRISIEMQPAMASVFEFDLVTAGASTLPFANS